MYVIPEDRIVSATDFRSHLKTILANIHETGEDLELSESTVLTLLLTKNHPGNRVAIPNGKKLYKSVRVTPKIKDDLVDMYAAVKGGLTVYGILWETSTIYLCRHPSYSNNADTFTSNLINRIVADKDATIKQLQNDKEIADTRIRDLETIIKSSDMKAEMLTISGDWQKAAQRAEHELKELKESVGDKESKKYKAKVHELVKVRAELRSLHEKLYLITQIPFIGVDRKKFEETLQDDFEDSSVNWGAKIQDLQEDDGFDTDDDDENDYDGMFDDEDD